MSASEATPAARTRPFYWSVRRELWEHRALYLAPLIAAGLVLFGFLVSGLHMVRNVSAADAATRAVHAMDTGNVEAFAKAAKLAVKTQAAVEMPFLVAAGFTFATVIVVVVFYGLGALYGERRDRTILFWKSLPVSDLTTVMAKATLPLVVAPVVIFTVTFATQLAMLAWSSLILLANGVSPSTLTAQLHFPLMWFALARALIVMSLWWSPVVAWLMLVSGWARRTPILWAVGPWAALCLVEYLAFQTQHVLGLIAGRLAGGYIAAFTVDGDGEAPISTLAGLNPLPLLRHPELWIGLAVAAVCFALAVRLRRYRDPI